MSLLTPTPAPEYMVYVCLCMSQVPLLILKFYYLVCMGVLPVCVYVLQTCSAHGG